MTARVHIYASANKLRESHPPNWIILTSKTVSRLDKNYLPRRTKSHAISLLYVHESYLIYSRLLSETQARACAHTDVDGEGEYPAWKFRETYGTFVREKRALRSSLCIIPECVCVCVRVCASEREGERARRVSFCPAWRIYSGRGEAAAAVLRARESFRALRGLAVTQIPRRRRRSPRQKARRARRLPLSPAVKVLRNGRRWHVFFRPECRARCIIALLGAPVSSSLVSRQKRSQVYMRPVKLTRL